MNVVTIDSARPGSTSFECYSARSADAVLTLRVPNRLLLEWSQNRGNKSYISLLNESVREQVVHVREDCARVEERLYSAARKLHSEMKRCRSGRKRQSYVGGEYHLFVLEGETTNIGDILDEREMRNAEVERWKLLVQEKESAIDSLLIDMAAEITTLTEEVEAKESELSAVREASGYSNKGKSIEDVQPRQARRKLSEVASLAKKALWFADTFGLIPESLNVRKAVSGQVVTLKLGRPAVDTPQPQQSSDDEKVAQILYLLDQFAISDEAYHELASISQDLPPSYKVKRKRNDINEAVEIRRIVGPVPGAYRPLKEFLHSRISQAVSTCTI